MEREREERWISPLSEESELGLNPMTLSSQPEMKSRVEHSTN